MASGARPPHRVGAHALVFALLLPLWCPPVLLWGCTSTSGEAEAVGKESAGATSVEVPSNAGAENLTCQVPSDCKDLPDSNVSAVREHITLLNVTCQSYENDCKAAAYAHEVIDAQEKVISEKIEQLESEIQHMDEEWSKTVLRLRELNMSITEFRQNVDQMQVVSQQVRAAEGDPAGGNASANASSNPVAGNSSSDSSATTPSETANSTALESAGDTQDNSLQSNATVDNTPIAADQDRTSTAATSGQADVGDSVAGVTDATVAPEGVQSSSGAEAGASFAAASGEADTSQDVVDDTDLVDADASQADALSNEQRAAVGADALPAAPAADELLRSFQAEAAALDGQAASP